MPIASVATMPRGIALLCFPVLVASQGHVPMKLPKTSVITQPMPMELVADDHLPKSFDWRDVNGRNFVVADVNQHIPQYCGSCWIHGTVAALNDRLKVRRNATWPDVMLSRQMLLNCVPGPNGTHPTGCFGGHPNMIHGFMRHADVPDESCNVWKAVQDDKCEPMTICSNCDVPAGFMEALGSGMPLAEAKTKFDFKAGCKPMENFVRYRVSDYGSIENTSSKTMEMDMMKEIYARGPIVCGISGAGGFMLGYTANAEKHEGVYVTDEVEPIDHDVELVGWGETASGLKYWAIRNSWGTYWGQNGWFKLARGRNQNNVETDCSWAIPYSEDLKLELEGKVLGDYHLGVHSVSMPAELSGQVDAKASQATPVLLTVVAMFSSMATILVSRLFQDRPRGSEPLLG